MTIEVTTSAQPEQILYGVWGKSTDKTIAKDIPAFSKKYYDMIGRPSGSILPFYVLSRDYNETTGQFDLFIAGKSEHRGLEIYCLPAGIYGNIAVRPKLGLLWGMAVGQAKR